MQFLATIINYAFDVYIFILLLRVIFQSVHASWHSPLVQFVVTVTNPVVNPVKKFIPGFRGIDFSIVVIAFILEVVEFYFTMWVSHGFTPNVGGVLTYAVMALINKTIYLYWFSILIWTVLSWIITNQQNPLSDMTGTISYPLIKSVRRFVPPIGGVDLSPLVVVLILYLILSFIVAPLQSWCFDWAVS